MGDCRDSRFRRVEGEGLFRLKVVRIKQLCFLELRTAAFFANTTNLHM
jgi:hypothetical protein